ncbi:MAG: hypothetical protein KDD48_00210 [Bdellovibrionales bacterium]|nr:hypothetical protein [Bdellovibrionales bacterium]
MTNRFTKMALFTCILLMACAKAPEPHRSPARPVVTIPDDTNGQTVTPIGNFDVSNTVPFASCMADCSSKCSEEYQECLLVTDNDMTACETLQNSCVSACQTLPWDQGGCANMTFVGPQGDDLVIFNGMDKASVELTFCVHKEEALVVNQGMLSFVTQRGHSPSDMINKGKRHKFNHINESQQAMATVGNTVVSGIDGQDFGPIDENLIRQALVNVNGEEHDWVFPGAVSFPLYRWVSNIDLSKPTRFYLKEVKKYGGSGVENHKNAVQRHFRHYWGEESSLDVVTITRAPRIKGNKIHRAVDCRFGLVAEFYYFQITD